MPGINDIMEEYNFDDSEKAFAAEAQTGNTGQINQTRIVSELIQSKVIEDTTNDLIESNELLAESNDKHSATMIKLTWALIAVAVVQILVEMLDLFV